MTFMSGRSRKAYSVPDITATMAWLPAFCREAEKDMARGTSRNAIRCAFVGRPTYHTEINALLESLDRVTSHSDPMNCIWSMISPWFIRVIPLRRDEFRRQLCSRRRALMVLRCNSGPGREIISASGSMSNGNLASI